MAGRFYAWWSISNNVVQAARGSINPRPPRFIRSARQGSQSTELESQTQAQLDHLIRRADLHFRSAAGRRCQRFAADRLHYLEVGHSLPLAPECSPLPGPDFVSD